MIAERVGAQVGLTWKLVKRRLWSRNLSRFGVAKCGFPWQDKS